MSDQPTLPNNANFVIKNLKRSYAMILKIFI